MKNMIEIILFSHLSHNLPHSFESRQFIDSLFRNDCAVNIKANSLTSSKYVNYFITTRLRYSR